MSKLGSVRRRVIDDVGERAVHAMEDGATVGFLAGLAVTFYPLAALLLTVLGGTPTRAGPVALLLELADLVRGDDARAQESYLIGSAAVGSVGGAAVGTALRIAAEWSGVGIPV